MYVRVLDDWVNILVLRTKSIIQVEEMDIKNINCKDKKKKKYT